MQRSASATGRRITRVLAHGVMLLAFAAPAAAVVGRIAGIAGTSTGARFRVVGVSTPIHQSPAVGARFVVTAFPLQETASPPSDPLFANGFE